MVRFNIECELSFPQRQFWLIRDTPTFTRFIIEDRLLKSLSASPPTSPPLDPSSEPSEHDRHAFYDRPDHQHPDWRTRTQHYSPRSVDCPDLIRPVVGDTLFNVSDTQYWNETLRPFHLAFNITPTFLTDLSSTRGDLTIEHFPPRRQRPACPDTARRHAARVRHNPRWAALYDVAAPSPSPSDTDEYDDDDDDDDDEASCSSASSDARKPAGTGTAARDGVHAKEDGGDDDATEDQENDLVKQAIELLPADDKSIHRIVGTTRVRILTVGWFVERAVVHNLRLFYAHYARTVYRFRCKLYRDFAAGDPSVPVAVVVQRFLDAERQAVNAAAADDRGHDEVCVPDARQDDAADRTPIEQPPPAVDHVCLAT